MRKLFLSNIFISILQITNAYPVTINPSITACLSDTTLPSLITGGTRTKKTCAYTQPNCQDGCPCCVFGASESWSCDCDSGYYVINQGTSTCSCGACPANSTCTSLTIFTCNTGYTKNAAGTACEQIICTAGKYLNSNTCADCPTSSGMTITSNAGSTKITDCYATGGSDSTGTYTFTEPCYYTLREIAGEIIK